MATDLLLDQLSSRIQAQRQGSRLLYHASIQVESHVTKKNRHRILKSGSKTWIGKSNHTRSAEARMILQLRSQAVRQALRSPIDQPIWAIFLFYFSGFYTKKGAMSLTLGDLSNLYQLPEDCLQKAGVLKNDALIMSHDLSRKLPSKTGSDYLDIFLLEFTNGLYRGV